jgi:hypothetical protein
VFVASFINWRPRLQSGERATILLLAVDKSQATVAFRYIRAAFREIPMLSRLVVNERSDSLELSNGTVVEVVSNNFRRVRGRTVVCAVLDELAYWRDVESATPDVETYSALVPAMATVEGSLLIAVSSPYRQSGLLYEKFRDHYGQDRDDVLALRAETRQLNPTISERVVQQAIERDPIAGASEWLATWRSDLASYLDEQLIAAAVDDRPGLELPPRSGVRFHCFADPSGGRGDAFAIAIAHAEGEKVVVDVVRARPAPFTPSDVVREFSELAMAYDCHLILGDAYSGEWVTKAFEAEGVSYHRSPRSKSQIYLECLPMWTQGRVSIPPHKKLAAELRGLERRVGRSGKDTVDHGAGLHDDLSNVVCGVLLEAGERPWEVDPDAFWSEGNTLSAQLSELAAEGVSPSEALMMVSSPVRPWDLEDTSRPGSHCQAAWPAPATLLWSG